MRFPRIAAGLGAVAAAGALLLAAAGPAAAAGTVNGPFYNRGEAGYQIQSAVSFNEVRTTVHIPGSGSVTGTPPGSSTSSFVTLEQNVNGGEIAAIGLVNISGSYYLYAAQDGFVLNTATGVPLPVAGLPPQITPVATLGVPAGHPLFSNQTGGSYYIEIHYSTREHLVQYIAGPSETDAAVLATAHSGFRFDGTFNAPAVETVNFGGATLPVSTPQSSFTRTGVTEPAGFNFGGIAGTRVTFDFFATDEAEATEGGGLPTIGNLVTLLPSPALPGVGSAFGVITGV